MIVNCIATDRRSRMLPVIRHLDVRNIFLCNTFGLQLDGRVFRFFEGIESRSDDE